MTSTERNDEEGGFERFRIVIKNIKNTKAPKHERIIAEINICLDENSR